MKIARLSILFAALLGACSEPPAPEPTPEAQLLWTESSRSIEVSCFGYWVGSMRFVATREQLSVAELDMLSRMRIIDSAASCVADVMGCSLTVAQADGTTTEIDAIETDSTCTDRRKVVSYESFDPFRQSLGCRYAKNSAQMTLGPDARCFNGLFTAQAGGVTNLGLRVDDAAPAYHVELVSCAQPERAGKLSFSLRDSDGTTVLGSSAAPADAGPNGACAAHDQTFPRTGTFALEVVAAPEILPGDFYLRFF
jgi:hypothetical protein